MGFTVENICGFLIRSRLMTADEMKVMYERWSESDGREAGADLGRFTRWLVANSYVTEYQAGLLTKGHAEPDAYFLNQYKIVDRLGRGRMAGVYKAIHTLGQTVAIKVLPPSRAKDPQMLGRFQREARLSLKLKHPNVVRSFQVGEANGLHFLVMEFLEGETFDEVLQRRKRLPPSEAVRIIHQALLGLQHIHEQGMVHRDLKPANLMLVPSGDKNGADSCLHSTVKILDIGLGRELFEERSVREDADRMELTAEGVLLGTPDYLAPEQARDPRNSDIRADIYSLGCVLYHALTGQAPFPDRNILSQMVRHATEPAKPLKEFNAAIPDGLQQIINWMLAKQPEQRYPTPERAAQALQVFLLAGNSPTAPEAEPPEMRNYLTWLEESASDVDVLTPELVDSVSGTAAAEVPPAPLARPAETKRAKSQPPSTPIRGKASRPSRQSFPAGARARTIPQAKPYVAPPAPLTPIVAAPEAAPSTAAPVAKAITGDEYDVELITVPAPQVPQPPVLPFSHTLSRWPGLSARDWMMIGIGAAAALGLVWIGIAIWALI